MRAYPPRRPGLTVAQHLDRLAGAHRALGGQALGSDVATLGIQLGEPPGGELSVRIDSDASLWLTGPVEEVARIILSAELIDRLRALP